MFILNRYIFLLIIFSGTVLMQEDLLDTLSKFVIKLLAGFELTSLFLFSLGTNYPPIDEDVTFWCVKPKGDELVQTYLNDPNINLKIDTHSCINFVVHGWLGGIDGGNRFLPTSPKTTSWMRPTSIIWSHMDECNVCSVDWSRMANYEYSVAALVNTKMVANYMIEFVDFLITRGMNVQHVAIAGHSLGAQVAGIVGRHYQGLIDAIYGVDPAGPGFTVPWDFGVGTRLSATDAKYVQCIHTSRGTLGTFKDCGHADFYLNGGYIQPGCVTVLCSHSRAHDIFQESMFPEQIFNGVKCHGSFANLITKLFGAQCSMETDRLGIHSDRRFGRFFLRTHWSSPFALGAET